MLPAAPKPSPKPAVRARALVVAYEADTCLLLTGLLTREGFYAGLVCNIADMGRLIRSEEPPHIVIVDDRGQPAHAVEGLIRAIRLHPLWKKVIVVLLSDKDGEERERTYFKLGVDDYLVKPLRTNALISRLIRRLSHA